MMIYTGLIVVAYLLGSVSSAIIVCHLLGLPDPRTMGSGNPGATNVLRTGNKKAAAIVLLGDSLKGLLPVLAAHALQVPLLVVGLTGLAALLGHLYPIFFHFKGGKGVATFIGVLLGIHWALGLAAITTWLFMAYVVKISSLSALVMVVLAPLYGWLILQDRSITIILGSMAVLIFWRHRSNIARLVRGEENKIRPSDESKHASGTDSETDSTMGNGF